MEIVAEGVEVTGPHGPLLTPTSLRVSHGQVALVVAEPPAGATALAVALAGRLNPTRGTVRLDGSAKTAQLRHKVAVVDAPEVTEPEGALTVRNTVSEGLSLAGQRAGRSAVRSWLRKRDLETHAEERFENLTPGLRTRVLVELAISDPKVEALVLDTPDRHGGRPADWYGIATEQAERGLAVIVLCAALSADKLSGPAPTETSTMDRNEGVR